MKLDSIVYDTSTLASALTEQLQIESPTFKAMYPSETATSMVNVMAGYGSMLQYMIVSSIANCYTDSAFSPSGIYQLAETLGNRLHGNIAASVTCELERTNPELSSIIIPSNSIFTVEGKPFFNPSAISFGGGVPTVKDVLLVQGTQTTYEKLTSGVEDEKIYFGSDFQVDPNYLHVYVNDVEWDIVDSFISYDKYTVLNIQEMQSVVVRTDSDGRCYVKFGNGINGLVPDAGSKVTISYVINDGEAGNILKNNLEVVLVTPIYYNDSDRTQLSIVANKTSTAYGGANTQDLMVLKESSPYVFASGERCIRRNDYTAMLLNKCGYKTCCVWGEYEQARLKGAYDKSMMNMVYYTGLKSFKYFAPYFIGTLNYSTMTPTNNNIINVDSGIYHWTGSLETSRALPGSVQITIENTEEPETKIVFTDSGGHGILFNNDDLQFDSDDLLDDFIDGVASLAVVTGGSTGYNTIENIVYNLPNSNLNSYYESKISPNRKIPVQIALNYLIPQKTRSLAGIKFYIPNGDSRYLQNSIGSFAVYGTNAPYPSYDNVSNNSDWAEVIPFTNLSSGTIGEWTNWVASSLFETGAGANITSASLDPVENGTTYYRDISRDSIPYSSFAWTTLDGTKTVYTAELIPVSEEHASEGVSVSKLYSNPEVTNEIGTVQYYTNWPTFSHYVIEIYSLHDGSTETLKMGKIKLLYADVEKNGERVTEISTIDYDNNGALDINISSASQMFNQFYHYNYVLENLTTTNYDPTLPITHEDLTYDYNTGYFAYHPTGILVAGTNYINGDIVSITEGSSILKYKITRVGPNGEVIDGTLLSFSGNVYFPDKTSYIPSSLESEVTGGHITVELDKDVFETNIGSIEEKEFLFTYDGTDWKDRGDNIAILADYGITVVGTPEENDTIFLTYTPASEEGYTTTLVSRPASILTVTLSPQSAEIVLDSRCYIRASNESETGTVSYFRSPALDQNLQKDSTLEAEVTGSVEVSLNKAQFESYVGTSSDITLVFTYDGTDWKNEDQNVVTLSDYGVTITTAASENDTITLTYKISKLTAYLAWTTMDAASEVVTNRTVYTEERDDGNLTKVGDQIYIYESSTMVPSSIGTVATYQPPLPAPEGFKLGLKSESIIFRYKVKLYGTLRDPDREHNVDYATDINMDILGLNPQDTTVYSARFNVNIENGDLISSDGVARGGKLNVTSDESLQVKASYYGNKLSETEIARIDSVIIDQYNHFTTYLEYVEPKIVNTYIKARVHYKDSINITEVKQNIQTAVNSLFELQPSSMGKTLYLSEVYNAIRDVEGVDYVLIDYPTSNVVIDQNQLLVLSELNLIDVV